ncbi:glycine zipper family protein [Nocardia higoensis]|uniref:glycine zipper family protein n=1 Tax=Nocardia higoensis TaxID=228599 RepID=UPI0002F51719|nr:glycine zipper family protein [Nocardia higoensis]
MNFRKSAAAAALVAGAMTVGAGVSYADPAPAAPEVDYSVKMVDQTIVTKLRGGTFSLIYVDVQPGAPFDPSKVLEPIAAEDQDDPAKLAEATPVAEIKDETGNLVLQLPLVFDVLGTPIPVKSEIVEDGTVLEITPEKPAGLNLGDKPLAVKPVASAVENQRAQNDFSSKFGIGTAIGSFVGTAVGAAIGCIATIAAGCVPGLLTGAGVGGILGTVAVGGPTLLAAGIELINTFNAPEGTTQWADKPAAPAEGAEQPK